MYSTPLGISSLQSHLLHLAPNCLSIVKCTPLHDSVHKLHGQRLPQSGFKVKHKWCHSWLSRQHSQESSQNLHCDSGQQDQYTLCLQTSTPQLTYDSDFVMIYTVFKKPIFWHNSLQKRKQFEWTAESNVIKIYIISFILKFSLYWKSYTK